MNDGPFCYSQAKSTIGEMVLKRDRWSKERSGKEGIDQRVPDG